MGVSAKQSVSAQGSSAVPGIRYGVLGGVSFTHMLNDMMQSLILAIYPLLQDDFDLSFLQVGLITLTFQLTASLLQPWVGYLADRRPAPYSLPVGMSATLFGLILLAHAPSYPVLLLAAGMVGIGSAVFHPESARVARMASGGRYGFAQSIFQIGGNVGQALGPLAAAWFVLGQGRTSVAWFALAALLAIIVLLQVSGWYSRNAAAARRRQLADAPVMIKSRARVFRILAILLVLCFSKFIYMASISTYYEFYLMHHFGVSLYSAQVHLFVFLGAVAVGTMIGGPIGDRIGRKLVIWVSILGVAPFTLLLPHVGLTATGILSAVIGILLASAFPAIIVYAQDLMPNRIGAVSGLFYGFSFGLGGIGAAGLGLLADRYSIEFVYQVCAWLPLLGLFAVFLPRLRPGGKKPPGAAERTDIDNAPDAAQTV
ncbi:MAG TPA: MFS transporter [Wenzhouxiangella sp.]|nr:MFS transporter [Wenzhouxiangella sp.]